MIGFLFLVSIVVLSQAGTLIRFADANALVICFWRLLFAVLLLVPFVVRGGRWRELTKLDRPEVRPLLASGLLLFIHFYFFFRSVQETTVANATIIFSINPISTALGAWLMFRERVRLHLLIALILGLLGVVVLFGETWLAGRLGAWRGDLWGVLSAIAFSAYILTGKQVRQKVSNLPFAACIYLQTAIYAGLACLLLDIPLHGHTPTTWWAFVALAIFPTLFGHAIFTHCLNYLDVTFMSCMTLVEPLLAAVAAYYLFGEPFTPWAGVAFVLTCASVLVLYAPVIRNRLARLRVREVS